MLVFDQKLRNRHMPSTLVVGRMDVLAACLGSSGHPGNGRNNRAGRVYLEVEQEWRRKFPSSPLNRTTASASHRQPCQPEEPLFVTFRRIGPTPDGQLYFPVTYSSANGSLFSQFLGSPQLPMAGVLSAGTVQASELSQLAQGGGLCTTKERLYRDQWDLVLLEATPSFF